MNKKFVILFSIFIILFNQIIKLNANDDTYINSSNITYNEKENIVELSENSKINFKNTNILIDKGIIDYNKDEFEVFGNFYLWTSEIVCPYHECQPQLSRLSRKIDLK